MRNTQIAAAQIGPWYTHRWPWLLMSGPFLVVLAASFSGWLAFSRQDALVVDDYYKQGNAINQDLRRERAATNMGLSLGLHYDPVAGKLFGTLLGFGHPVTTPMKISLSHASNPEKDRILLAVPDGTGRFEVSMPALEASHWKIIVEGDGHAWRLDGDWKWPQEAGIDIKADLPAAD